MISTCSRTALAAALAAGLLAFASPPVRADEPQWTDLTADGELQHWSMDEAERDVWLAQGSAIAADNRKGKNQACLVSKEDYTHFDLDLEVRIEEGQLALRKWHSFTIYLRKEELGRDGWVHVSLTVRGADVRFYIDGQPVSLSSENQLPGTNTIWLMADPGSLVGFRNVRVRRVEKDSPDPFIVEERPEPPDLSDARKLFSGSSLLGWDREGDWTLAAGAVIGRRQGEGACWMATGRLDWGDGLLGFEFRGLSDGEALSVLLNYDPKADAATEVRLPGSSQLDPEQWVPVVVAFRGEKVVLWLLGERHELPRTSRHGRIGFALLPGTECALRDIRVRIEE
ncbi:MAG: hypothetical protein HY720_11450 [Planctomycetes bacterium]|nr:hypothetical protein [Planctomycetota bacterium]